MISVTCHCGAVRIDVAAAPETVTSCNCSICRRLGALWAFFPLDAVALASPEGGTEEYVWGEATRRFVRCGRCGCTTHVLPAAPKPTSKIEVNARLFDPALLRQLRVRQFDGADTWKYIDEPTTDCP